MRKELGEDGIILATRTVDLGHGASMVEVTGALDEQPEPEKRENIEKRDDVAAALRTIAERQFSTKATQEKTETVAKSTKQEDRGAKAAPTAAGKESARAGDPLLSIAVSDGFEHINKRIDKIEELLRYRLLPHIPPRLQKAYTMLVDAGVEESEAADALSVVMSDTSIKAEEAFRAAGLHLCRSIKIQALQADAQGRRKIALIGPPGSGKTTLLAKLAAIAAVVEKRDVCVISADSQRIGAVDQLQRICAIAGIPFAVAYSTQELRTLVQREQNRDYLFIDTPGMSPFSSHNDGSIGALLESATPTSAVAVISVHGSRNYLRQSLHFWREAGATSIALSKMDDIYQGGEAIPALADSPLPVSYLSTGPIIPDDVEQASRNRIAELLLRTAPTR